MTYNILEGGITAGLELESIEAIVVKRRPDVLALQECNRFEDNGRRTLYRLERALGMRSLFAETRTGFHIALFVRRAEILESHVLLDWFHHGALRAELLVDGKHLTVVSTHLCPFSGESRVREAQYLSTHAREERVVIMGDMNSISARDSGRLALDQMLPYRRSRHFVPGTETVDTRAMDVFESAGLVDLWHRAHPETHGPTLPTPLLDKDAKPELRLDYVFTSPTLADGLQSCTVLMDEHTQNGSDHFPIVADIAF
jgi:exodeoxyribonuclease-3